MPCICCVIMQKLRWQWNEGNRFSRWSQGGSLCSQYFRSADTEQRPGRAVSWAALGWGGVGRPAAAAQRTGRAQQTWGGWWTGPVQTAIWQQKLQWRPGSYQLPRLPLVLWVPLQVHSVTAEQALKWFRTAVSECISGNTCICRVCCMKKDPMANTFGEMLVLTTSLKIRRAHLAW